MCEALTRWTRQREREGGSVKVLMQCDDEQKGRVDRMRGKVLRLEPATATERHSTQARNRARTLCVVRSTSMVFRLVKTRFARRSRAAPVRANVKAGTSRSWCNVAVQRSAASTTCAGKTLRMQPWGSVVTSCMHEKFSKIAARGEEAKTASLVAEAGAAKKLIMIKGELQKLCRAGSVGGRSGDLCCSMKEEGGLARSRISEAVSG